MQEHAGACTCGYLPIGPQCKVSEPTHHDYTGLHLETFPGGGGGGGGGGAQQASMRSRGGGQDDFLCII